MPRRVSVAEFVAMTAMLFAVVAFSTDAMLPAFPEMAGELTPEAPNRIQLVISAFMIGLGAGTFVAGPLSDRFGRKAVVVSGVAIFIAGCTISYFSQSLEMLLVGRMLQGLGGAGPRIGPLAMTRDLFEGRRMAQISSIIMTVFMLFPAIAPSIGKLVLSVADWRAIFAAFALFALTATIWLGIRQDETLPPSRRRSLNLPQILATALDILRNRRVMAYTLALTLGFAELLAIISSIQPVYDQHFGMSESFPIWFALGAFIAASGTLVNAALVMRMGMRRLVILAFGAKIVLGLTALVLMQSGLFTGTAEFTVWFIWSTTHFFMAGLIFGNLNALALQPLGHVAGTAASVITGVSTVGAALFAVPIGQAFDGTPLPLMLGNACLAAAAFLVMRRTVDEPLEA